MIKALHHPMEVRESRFGKGIFAVTAIKKGTELLTVKGTEISFLQAVGLEERESYTVQVSAGRYLLPDYPFYLSNHSCNPNCGVTPDLKFVALQDIAKEEELLWDYSTTMLERYWTMECQCGNSNCRGVIRDFDLLPVFLQKKYINLNIVQPFIKKIYDNNKNYINRSTHDHPVSRR